MSKDIKKIIWCVVYGISLVACIMGFITLFINMLSVTVYNEFRSSSYPTNILNSILEDLRFVFILATAAAFLFLAVTLIKAIFCKKKTDNKRLLKVLWGLHIGTLVLVFASFLYAAILAFTLPPYNDTYPDAVSYDRLNFFMSALSVVTQFFVPAVLMIVFECFLQKLSKNTASIAISQNEKPADNTEQNKNASQE